MRPSHRQGEQLNSPTARLSRLRQLPAPYLRAGMAILGAALGLAAVALGGAGTYPAGPLEVEVVPAPAIRGRTVIELPPLGTVEAATHAAPIRLTFSVRRVGLDGLEKYLASRPTVAESLEEVRSAARSAAPRIALRVLVLGATGGLAGALLIRAGRRGLITLAAGALAPVLWLGSAALGFDARAFREPTLTGTLTAAPSVLGPLEDLDDRFDDYRRQLDVAGAAVYRVYRFLSAQSTVPSDAIRLLHIGDLHLNPVGYDLARTVASSFRVHAVLDSGDTTAGGSPIENGFLSPVGEFGVPYLWVRGNHDSETTQRAVMAFPNARVLEGGAAEVEGLQIFGVGDPIFTPDRDREESSSEESEVKQEFANRVLEMIRELPYEPDIVLVHDSRVAGRLAGRVPVVVSGHAHRFSRDQREGTNFLTVGSTGGSGLESLAPGQGSPNALQVLYLSRDSGELLAVDRIEVGGNQPRFSLRRTMIEPAPRGEASAIAGPPLGD